MHTGHLGSVQEYERFGDHHETLRMNHLWRYDLLDQFTHINASLAWLSLPLGRYGRRIRIWRGESYRQEPRRVVRGLCWKKGPETTPAYVFVSYKLKVRFL